MFAGWHIDDTEIFGPYELLDFPLRGPYIDGLSPKPYLTNVFVSCVFLAICQQLLAPWT
ncbi:hypothetical protein ACSBR1_033074 [Camellia fascicularis]